MWGRKHYFITMKICLPHDLAGSTRNIAILVSILSIPQNISLILMSSSSQVIDKTIINDHPWCINDIADMSLQLITSYSFFFFAVVSPVIVKVGDREVSFRQELLHLLLLVGLCQVVPHPLQDLQLV